MGNKITTAMIKTAYYYARTAYHEEMETGKAMDCVVSESGMSKGSVIAYFHAFFCMLDGKVYHRTIIIEATDFYLESIRTDYGRDRLLSACHAAKQHVEYYYSVRGVRLQGIENIAKRYIS